MILETLEFPLVGPLREPLIILESIILCFFLELAFYFWIRVRSEKKEIKSLQEKAYIWLFLGLYFMIIFYIVADFFAETPEARTLFLNFGYFGEMFGSIFFLYGMEKQVVFLKKHLITTIYAIMMTIHIILFFVAIQYTQTISWVFFFLLMLFLFLYIRALSSKIHLKDAEGNFNWDLIKIFTGFFCLGLGFGLTTDFAISFFGLGIRLVGDILVLFSILFISLFFTSVPSLLEYYWQEKLVSIFLMMKSGLCIYYKFFKDKIEDIDETLVSGQLATVKIILEEITDSEGVTIIEKQEKTTIIQPGQFIIGVSISDEHFNSIQILLKTFVEKIEKIYYKIFQNWDGNLNVFKPIEEIANAIFT